jgi:formylglycine-generating enzyme required for sulfatase activity
MTRNALASPLLPAAGMALALLACSVLAQEPAATTTPAAPPAPPPITTNGLILIPAGDVIVGLTEKQALPLIQQARNKDDRWVMAGEVGQHTVSLPEFWIAPTHVTNEMYLEYVNATGARPPATWLRLTKEELDQIILAGQTTNPAFKWDEETQGLWWDKHWKDPGVQWEMPASRALEPVVFVTWHDAMAYCAWAGLRLPTEEELVRAGRGDQFQDYPFGAKFDRALVEHNATTPSNLAFKRLPVGMLKGNVSGFGVHDLVGNVWSWTSSAYLPFEGFPGSGLTVTIPGDSSKKPEKVSVIPNWDGSRKVLKGGNFSSSQEFCRLDVRVGCDPTAAVSIVGFRVAATGLPAADAATLRARTVRSSVLGFSPDRDLDRARVLGVERRGWPDMAAIAARRNPPETPGVRQPELPPDYRVFGPIEVFAVAPLANPFEREDFPEIATLEKAGLRELQFPTLGVLTTTVALSEPELPAGNYVLAWMPAFKDRELLELGALLPEKDMPKTPVEPDEEKAKRAGVTGRLILPGKEHLLFLDQDGVAVGAVPLLDDFKLQAEKQVRHDLELDLVKQRWIVHLELPGKAAKSYGLRFGIKTADPAATAEGHWDGDHFGVLRPKPGANVGNVGIGPRERPR